MWSVLLCGFPEKIPLSVTPLTLVFLHSEKGNQKLACVICFYVYKDFCLVLQSRSMSQLLLKHCLYQTLCSAVARPVFLHLFQSQISGMVAASWACIGRSAGVADRHRLHRRWQSHTLLWLHIPDESTYIIHSKLQRVETHTSHRFIQTQTIVTYRRML